MELQVVWSLDEVSEKKLAKLLEPCSRSCASMATELASCACVHEDLLPDLQQDNERVRVCMCCEGVLCVRVCYV